MSVTVKTDWIAVTNNDPCPVCGGPDNCKVHVDGRSAWCGRREPPSWVSTHQIKQNGGGQFFWWLEWIDGLSPVSPPPRNRRHHNSTKSSAPEVLVVSWEEVSRNFEAHPKIHLALNQLSEKLGVSEQSLRKLHVGAFTSREGRENCYWSFPERDASGKIIGISRRHLDGRKRFMGNRGLYYSLDWEKHPGPILLPEGGSDTAALITMGASVIGRPSNLGGVDFLAGMLYEIPVNREIIILGERDWREPKAESHPFDCLGCLDCYPGLYGARKTATDLADKIGRDVQWALTPEGSKDVRAWLIYNPGKTVNDFLPLIQRVVVSSEIRIERTTKDHREKLSLDEFREESAGLRASTIGRPGVYFDCSPTGAGKSHGDILAIKKVMEIFHDF